MNEGAIDQATATINGREGLLIPDITAETWKGQFSAFTPLHFFHGLWEANGFNTTTEYPYGSYRSGQPCVYSHELVLGADATRPLTVVRGSYTPRSSKAIEEELLRNKYSHRQSYDESPVVTGTERHEIVVPPKQLGPFAVAWSVEYRHQQGGSNNEWQRNTPIFHKGPVEMWRRQFYPPEENDWRKAEAKTSRAYSRALHRALGEIVAYLS